MMVSGMFFPKFAASMGLVIFCGRELYRYGYMTPDGPNSWIREAGAIPLNIAELLLVISVGTLFSRYMAGSFFSNRKFV